MSEGMDNLRALLSQSVGLAQQTGGPVLQRPVGLINDEAKKVRARPRVCARGGARQCAAVCGGVRAPRLGAHEDAVWSVGACTREP